jgi:choloylglycine hydrolase
MKYLCVLMFFLGVSEAAFAQQTDSLAIVQAAMDYAEGWYNGDPARMERAIHPDFNKARPVQSVAKTGITLNYSSYSQLIEGARVKAGYLDESKRKLSVTVLEINEDIECTSFCLDNNGYAIFGSNFDYGQDISEGLIFVNKRNVTKSYWQPDSPSNHARWTSKYGSVSFNLVMSQLSWAGMNEAGLVISTMQLDGSKSPEPDNRPWIYSNYWLQYVLDNFSTVDEVIASDSAIRIFEYVDHYLVSDRFGNCATIEFINGKMVSHTGNNLPVKVLANSSYENSVDEWRKTMLGKNSGKPVTINNSSIRRFIGAADRVSTFKTSNSETAVNEAFDILDKVSGQKTNGSPTRWSIVFDTKNLQIYFRTIVHNEIRVVDLRKLDFSCKTPVKMIDINEKLSGDITSQLKDYSFQMHFDFAMKAWRK